MGKLFKHLQSRGRYGKCAALFVQVSTILVQKLLRVYWEKKKTQNCELNFICQYKTLNTSVSKPN